MKLLLSLLGTIAVTSSSVAFGASNIYLNHEKESNSQLNNQQPKIEEDIQVNWKTLGEETSNYFKDLTTNQGLISTQENNPTLSNETLKNAQQKSVELLKEFQDLNLSYSEIIVKISEKFPNFKEIYDNYQNLEKMDLSSYLSLDDSNSSSLISVLSNTNYKDQLSKTINDINIAKATFLTTSVAAGVAAATFYALAPWSLGATIPWAVGCTIASATAGTVGAILGTVSYAMTQEKNAWKGAVTNISFLIRILNASRLMVTPVFISAESTLVSSAWAFPPAAILIGLIAAAWAWFEVSF